MLKRNFKKVMICLFFITILAMVMKVSLVNGSDIFNQLNNLTSNNATEIPEGENNNVTNTQNTLNTQNTQNTLPTNNNVNGNVPNTTPYTGIADNFNFVFIIIFAISAVYAYKKVKEYND